MKKILAFLVFMGVLSISEVKSAGSPLNSTITSVRVVAIGGAAALAAAIGIGILVSLKHMKEKKQTNNFKSNCAKELREKISTCLKNNLGKAAIPLAPEIINALEKEVDEILANFHIQEK